MRAQISDAVKLDIKWSLTCQLSSTKSKRCPVGWESNTGNLVVSCVSCPLRESAVAAPSTEPTYHSNKY